MAEQQGLLSGVDPENDGEPTGNAYLDSLIWGAKWDITSGPVEYFFDGAGVSAFNAAEKQAFLDILANFSSVCDISEISFQEAATKNDADIVWRKQASSPNFIAWHDVPDELFIPAEGVFVTQDAGWQNVSTQGSFFYSIVLHELGHGMGLAHPHDGGDQEDATTFPGVTPNSELDKGDNGLNQSIWTVMSYNDGWDQAPGVNRFGSGPSYGWAGTLMAFDIAALQYLYGVNNTYKTSDDAYVLPTANGNGTFWSCLWDAGGNDTISNAGKSGAATINLNDAPLLGPNAGGYVSRVAGIKGGFTIANGAEIENATGGDGNDYIVGNELDNILIGGLGIDTVSYELSEAGVTVDLNIQDGATPQDTVGAGKDTLSGFENLVGSVFNDTLSGDGNVNKLDGGAGIDTVDFSYLGAGNNLVLTLGALTVATGVVAQTSTSGVAGDIDTVKNFENVIGGEGNDTFTGNAGANSLSGGDGDDKLSGLAGIDILNGGNGDDLLIGGLGSDTLDGGAEGPLGDTASFAGITTSVVASLVNGDGTGKYKNGAIDETDQLIDIENLIGGSGADTLTGDDFDNIIEGGAGNDTLDGGEGSETLGDTVSYKSATAGVTVNLSIVGAEQNTGGAGKDKISNFENILGSAKDDKLTGDIDANKIEGGAGNDTLGGGADDDELFGGDGNDTLIGGAGADKLDGGAGINTASFATAGSAVNLSLEAGKGFGGEAEDDEYTNIQNLAGSDKDDFLFGSNADANTILGSKGNDVILGDQSGLGPRDTLNGGEGDDTISGYAGDTLDGGLGDDTLHALPRLTQIITVNLTSGLFTDGAAKSTIKGFEHVTGSDAHDTLTGTANINKITGDNGNDTIEGLAGADILDGEGSNLPSLNDTVVYTASNAAVTINLLDQGTETINDDAVAQIGGHAAGDKLYGFENIVGSKFNDTLTGDNSDNIIEGGLGNDTMDGLASGANGNTVSYAGATANVTVDLNIVGGEQNTGGGGKDKISNFQNIIGGKGADILTGDADKNTIDGRAGNDIIQGGVEADRLIGGLGIDTLSYANSAGQVQVDLAQQGATDINGNPTGNGSPQNNGDAAGDLLWGFENLAGSALNDSLFGDNGVNVISGGDDSDLIVGRGGSDTLDGGADTDTLNFSYLGAGQNLVLTLGTLTVATGAVAQTSTSGIAGDIDKVKNFENAIGGSGNDTFVGNAGVNFFLGNSGDDKLSGLAGGDILQGDIGNDILQGGLGADSLDGGADDDTASYNTSLIGVTVNLLTDKAEGGDADGDTLDNIENLIGSAKNDTLTGDDFDNVIEGGLGDDTLAGGLGNDTLSYAGATAAVTFSLALQGGLQNTGGGGKDTASGFENLIGGKGADKLTGDANANTIEGGAGNDIINGGGGDDTLSGEAGNDTLTGGDGTDTYYSGAGVDTIIDGGTDGKGDIIYLSGTDGVGDVYNLGADSNDVMEFKGTIAISLSNFSAAAASIEALNANGLDIIGTTAADNIDLSGFTSANGLGTIDGGGGNDKITGTLSGEDIFGGAGNDILSGGGGADDINGGTGNDTLTGGGGDDTFIYQVNSGIDTVKDFVAGAGTDDQIDLSALNFASYAALTFKMSEAGGHVTLTFSATSKIIIENTSILALHEDDFVL